MALTDNEILAPFQNIGGVTNSDCVLLHVVSGNTTGKVTLEILRAYLNDGFAVTVNNEGYLVIGGEVTETKLIGMTLRVGSNALEISNDNGGTWLPLITFNQLGDKIIEYISEDDYDDLVENEEINEDKLYFVYEE